MAGKNSVLFFFALLGIMPALLSCKKQAMQKGYGRYAVAIAYHGTDNIELELNMDGMPIGKFCPVPNIAPSRIATCSDIDNPEQLLNVFVIPQILEGKHLIEIKGVPNNTVKVLNFEMADQTCVFQEVEVPKE